MSAQELLLLAKTAQPQMTSASTLLKNEALREISRQLVARTNQIIEGNALDLIRAQESGLSKGLQDRLRLDAGRIKSLSDAVLEVIGLPDPVGEDVSGKTLPNGLKLQQVRVPFGVIGVIYEARPNVTIDLAALAIKSGNALVLRGGSAAINTNQLLVALLQDSLTVSGLPGSAIQSVDEFGRDGALAMMHARGVIDVLIPRGSADLIKTVVTESKVPVIETGDGVVHVFLDESADTKMSVEIVVNSKVQRPSVCNALETLLVHKGSADVLLPLVGKALQDNGVTIHGCEKTLKYLPAAVPATEGDWHAEYFSLDLAVKVVDSFDDALAHIAKYSTHHTESILTADLVNAERFLQEVDSAVVMVNASTRFTDGGEFGFGSEVGISTQKLHARGPMGLRELTSTKWLVRGSGQVRS